MTYNRQKIPLMVIGQLDDNTAKLMFDLSNPSFSSTKPSILECCFFHSFIRLTPKDFSTGHQGFKETKSR